MRASPTRPPKTHRITLHPALPMPPGECWGEMVKAVRPENVKPKRWEQIVRGALRDRFEEMSSKEDALSRLADHFEMREEKIIDLFYVLMYWLFIEDMEPDAEIEAEIIALRGHRNGLVPEGGLERCSEEMMEAFAKRVAAGRRVVSPTPRPV